MPNGTQSSIYLKYDMGANIAQGLLLVKTRQQTFELIRSSFFTSTWRLTSGPSLRA